MGSSKRYVYAVRRNDCVIAIYSSHKAAEEAIRDLKAWQDTTLFRFTVDAYSLNQPAHMCVVGSQGA